MEPPKDIPVINNPMIGLRVRVYSTFFSEEPPNDLNLSMYYEGVIQRNEPLMEGLDHYFYRIDKVIINGKAIEKSWKVQSEADFYFGKHHPSHYVFELSNQLELI